MTPSSAAPPDHTAAEASAPWWTSAVVYQVYPRSFADSDGDGVGDLRGITAHLDHIARLGADVIWLSPIYRSPMADNGYDISDYDAIDPLFGTEEDFAELVAGVHERGMKLVLDLVVNHTSEEHPWFVESRDPASPKRDWFFWRPARPGHEPGTPGAEPTNWGSFFSEPAWTFDPASGEYYLHLFARQQPDLNWENPQVRAEVHALMRRWIARGVDGFRMDVMNLVSKTLPFTDGPAAPGELCFDRSVVVDGPRLIEFLEEMNREVGLSERELFTVGEMVQVDVEHARAYTSRHHPRLGMVFTFEHMELDCAGDKFSPVPLHLPALKKNLARWQAGLAEEGWNSLYWDNHDQARAVSRFGDDSPQHRTASAKTLATVLHLHQGTPFIYQGEELGMTNGSFTAITDFRDVETLNHYAARRAQGADPEALLAGLRARSRDNARTPMCWDASPMAGFTTGTPWLPVNGDFRTINAAAQIDDPHSVFAHYRELIRLRHEVEVVRHGRFELLLPEHEHLWVFTRTLGEAVLLVVANMSSQAVGVPVAELPSLTDAELLLTSRPDADRDIQALEPWESRVYLLL